MPERIKDFDQLVRVLKQARKNGAASVVGHYYDPYDSDNQQCQELQTIGDSIVGALDDNLLNRSHQAGFRVADFRPSFAGHGAGSEDPYVFGKQCYSSDASKDMLPKWMGGGGGRQALALGCGPHLNNAGTTASARPIFQEYDNAH